jgi:conjugative relaxase-like TrwC/TraI family protein
MIRFHASRSAGDAIRYYTHLTLGDYYTRDGSSVSAVSIAGGKLAERMGLDGRALEPEEFAALAQNRHPETGEQLTPRMKQNRRVGWDVTADVSKSATLLWALAGDERIPELAMRVDQQVMRLMERDMRVRVRAKGQDSDKVTGEGLWSSHMHGTGRPTEADQKPDPHLHFHNFWFNLTSDNGRPMAAETGEMHRKSEYYRRVFDALMAEGLRELGYDVERRGHSYEIAGISRELIEKFSRRTAEIDEEARERGITDPEEKDALGAKTRRSKRTDLSDAELRDYWRSRLTEAEGNQITAIHARALARSGSGAVPSPQITAEQAEEWARRHRYDKEAVVEDWKIVASALAYGVGSVKSEDVWAALEESIKQNRLLARVKDGRRLLTSPEAWEREQGIIAFARDGQGTRPPLGPPRRAFTRDWLNGQQKQAVRHIWNSCSLVTLLRGGPGAGKTTLLEEAVEGIEANGFKVFAFAPSAEASRSTLRELFPEADTVARLLKDVKLQQRLAGQVVVLDEAGLQGGKEAAGFFALCQRLNCRAIVVGDTHQHHAVEHPGTLRLLETKAGLRVAEVTEIQRQRGKPKEVVERLNRGDIDGALKLLKDIGGIRELSGPGRERQLARDYLRAVGQKKGGKPVTALVISPTHAEGERITAVIRQELKDRKKLKGRERELVRLDKLDLSEAERGDAVRYAQGDVIQFYQNAKGGFTRGERVTVTGRDDLGRVCVATGTGQVKPLRLDEAGKFQVFERKTLLLAPRDRVRFTGNGWDKSGEYQINNGMLHTIRRFKKNGDFVLENGRVVSKDYGHLTQGYAITPLASQSKTVDQVFAGMSARSFAAMSQQGLLVTLSRARDRTVIYTDDLGGMTEAARRSEERLTATELLDGDADRRAKVKAEDDHVRHLQRYVRVVGEKAGALARIFGAGLPEWPGPSGDREPPSPQPGGGKDIDRRQENGYGR